MGSEIRAKTIGQDRLIIDIFVEHKILPCLHELYWAARYMALLSCSS